METQFNGKDYLITYSVFDDPTIYTLYELADKPNEPRYNRMIPLMYISNGGVNLYADGEAYEPQTLIDLVTNAVDERLAHWRTDPEWEKGCSLTELGCIAALTMSIFTTEENYGGTSERFDPMGNVSDWLSDQTPVLWGWFMFKEMPHIWIVFNRTEYTKHNGGITFQGRCFGPHVKNEKFAERLATQMKPDDDEFDPEAFNVFSM